MRAHSKGWLLGLGLALLPVPALSAAPTWPTQEAIERARNTLPFPDMERFDQVPVPGLPKIAPSQSGVDIESLAGRHADLYAQHRAAPLEGPLLRIFVTLAMPEQSLRLLVDQAERSGATIVLRGLKENSMRKTTATVQSLIGTRKVAWEIDPEAFARYSVRHAPTFVLTRAPGAEPQQSKCSGSCTTPIDAYFSVAGDVSLDYALDALVRRNPDAGGTAAPFLKRLRAAP